MSQRSFFDRENRLSLSLGDPLKRLTAAIPWERLRSLLELVHEKARKSNAGRKPFDVVLMFKMLALQTLYNLAGAGRVPDPRSALVCPFSRFGHRGRSSGCHHSVAFSGAAAGAGVTGDGVRFPGGGVLRSQAGTDH